MIAAISNNDLMEFCVWDTPIRREMIRKRFEVVDGWIRIPDGPGLGIEVNDQAIEKYRVDR